MSKIINEAIRQCLSHRQIATWQKAGKIPGTRLAAATTAYIGIAQKQQLQVLIGRTVIGALQKAECAIRPSRSIRSYATESGQLVF
jgi:hypothetical protein